MSIKKSILIGLAVLAGFVLISWALMATNIISFGIQREAIQQSQPYVETKVSLLHKLHTDWFQLDTEIAELQVIPDSQDIIKAKRAQQKNIVIRMEEEANLISASQIPDSIRIFLETH